MWTETNWQVGIYGPETQCDSEIEREDLNETLMNLISPPDISSAPPSLNNGVSPNDKGVLVVEKKRLKERKQKGGMVGSKSGSTSPTSGIGLLSHKECCVTMSRMSVAKVPIVLIA